MRVKGKYKKNNWWRNFKIRLFVFLGRSKEHVAYDYNLTRQRVQQIVRKK